LVKEKHGATIACRSHHWVADRENSVAG
jgi:hypothetical protein